MANNEIVALITEATSYPISTHIVQQIIPLLDLTSLNETDKETTIKQLCARAFTPIGNVAAICIYPQFISIAQQALFRGNTQIATVANFPEGSNDLADTTLTIEDAINDGAHEIDVVMPYQAYLKGDHTFVESFIRQCKEACGTTVILKVILETGALSDVKTIYNASRLVIENGADFIKTSTGKINIGATLTAATVMLQAIKDSNCSVGFKAAGGVRTIEDAAGYLHLAETIMGKEWITPQHFRIGASTLLEKLLEFNNKQLSNQHC